jgi:hypothetical protein
VTELAKPSQGLLGPKFQYFIDDMLVHWCPGCCQLHPVAVDKPNSLGAFWTWNGNKDQPTFTPSFHLRGICHYFIQDGKIDYLNDSTHFLAGQTVELPNIPAGELLDD